MDSYRCTFNFGDYTGKEINLHGQSFTIEKVIIHEGAKKPNKALFDGDAAPLMAFLKSTSDVALIKLSKPATHIKPLPIYSGSDEVGKIITAYGRGSTGNGIDGSTFSTKKQKILRTMQNRIELAEGNWLSITLDNEGAVALEGIDGSGDSGGHLLLAAMAMTM